MALPCFALLSLVMAGLPAPPALADNIALSPLGAAIIAASSANAQAGPEAVALMRGNLLTATPTAWLSNGEIRYIFGAGNQAQSITLALGREAAIIVAGVSFRAGDRPLVGPLAVAGAPAAAPGAFALLAAAVGQNGAGRTGLARSPRYPSTPALSSTGSRSTPIDSPCSPPPSTTPRVGLTSP